MMRRGTVCWRCPVTSGANFSRASGKSWNSSCAVTPPTSHMEQNVSALTVAPRAESSPSMASSPKTEPVPICATLLVVMEDANECAERLSPLLLKTSALPQATMNMEWLRRSPSIVTNSCGMNTRSVHFALSFVTKSELQPWKKGACLTIAMVCCLCCESHSPGGPVDSCSCGSVTPARLYAARSKRWRSSGKFSSARLTTLWCSTSRRQTSSATTETAEGPDCWTVPRRAASPKAAPLCRVCMCSSSLRTDAVPEVRK
mmetsp:Transcript_26809/g.79924  ORF Transcript_26809/g.79924 Transcript_26809/m.79924 type:complete len:259 (+) Transcript_26809:258-1034(+)